jgi:EARLY FLOWERING 3 protein
MRGRKDEEKLMSPMFPRLHVNDTEKGGPRAPPRNKMALYEQLSIPSQGFTSGSASMLPILPSNGSSLTPLMSSGYVSSITYAFLFLSIKFIVHVGNYFLVVK